MLLLVTPIGEFSGVYLIVLVGIFFFYSLDLSPNFQEQVLISVYETDKSHIDKVLVIDIILLIYCLVRYLEISLIQKIHVEITVIFCD